MQIYLENFTGNKKQIFLKRQACHSNKKILQIKMIIYCCYNLVIFTLNKTEKIYQMLKCKMYAFDIVKCSDIIFQRIY